MTTSASTTTLVLIGWDDIKGRPIYSKKQQQASSSSCAVPAKKKTKAPVKKKGTRRSNFGKNHQRKKNGNNIRRSIPTVQVAVGSLLSSSSGGTTDYNDNVVFSFNNDSPSQINPSETALKPSAARRRKVSFSPTISSKSDNDITNNDSSSNKLGFAPSVKKSWDSRKRKQGYGSKKFSRGSSTGYISPVFGLDGVVDGEDDGAVGWNRDAFASSPSSSVGSNDDCDDGMLSVESEPERLDDIRYDKNLSSANDEDFLTYSQPKNNDDDGCSIDLSLNNRLLETIPRDIQSNDGHDSMTSSLDNNQSLGSEEEGNDGNGSSFSYGDLDKRDDFVHSPSIQRDDSIPEMIHVEADVPVTNGDIGGGGGDNDDDLTVKAKDEEPNSTKTTNGIGHNDTPSTKTVEEETSYKLHSGGTNDFIDYDIPLDDPSHTDNNQIHGKKRSYGCSEKPVWVSSKKRGAKTASTVTTSDNAVGWDEGKCRPIFHVKAQKNVAHENATLDEIHDEDAGIDFASDDVNDATIKSHKSRRQYSSRFRKTSLAKAIERMSVLTCPKEDKDHSDSESLQEEGDCSRDDANGDNENEKANVKSDMDLDLEIEDVVNDENARHIQPTESSSLEAARAFFRYLDSNHRLIVDQTGASPRISSEVIRTTRRIVHSDQLQTEYSEYCDMLAETVAPITITEFANNWNRYFVGKGIRDGLFDED